jgi:hypothetical protein
VSTNGGRVVANRVELPPFRSPMRRRTQMRLLAGRAATGTILLILATATLMVGGVANPFASPLDRQGAEQLPPPLHPGEGASVYQSDRLALSITIPSKWSRVVRYPERWVGPDGFVALSAEKDVVGETAIEGPTRIDIDESCARSAAHHLHPYGTVPAIEHSATASHPACFVWPSVDQEFSSNGSLLIVEAPSPIRINGVDYQRVTLSADVDHIREIAASLTFD